MILIVGWTGGDICLGWLVLCISMRGEGRMLWRKSGKRELEVDAGGHAPVGYENKTTIGVPWKGRRES
jgi:hypothetical protein